jgi:hypothetical protein
VRYHLQSDPAMETPEALTARAALYRTAPVRSAIDRFCCMFDTEDHGDVEVVPEREYLRVMAKVAAVLMPHLAEAEALQVATEDWERDTAHAGGGHNDLAATVAKASSSSSQVLAPSAPSLRAAAGPQRGIAGAVAHNAGYITYEGLRRSLFEICDLWTLGISAGEVLWC